MPENTEITTPEVELELTPEQAQRRVIAGVNREGRRDANQCRDLLHDACALQGHNVRKLATVAEAQGKLQVGFESYLSYMSNANGIAGMFEFNVEAIDEFLEGTKWGLRGLFNAFRELFGPAKPEADEEPADGEGTGDEPAGSLLEVVLSALPHLSADERQQVAAALIALDTAEDDAAEAA